MKNNYEIKKNFLETDYNYSLRKLFINYYNPKNKKELNNAIMYSNIWCNIIFLKCKYNNDIENNINNLINEEKMDILKKKIFKFIN